MGVNQLFEKPALTPRETGPEKSNLLNILFSRKIAHAYTDKKQQQHGNINLDRLASFQANNKQSTWLNFSFFFSMILQCELDDIAYFVSRLITSFSKSFLAFSTLSSWPNVLASSFTLREQKRGKH